MSVVVRETHVDRNNMHIQLLPRHQNELQQKFKRNRQVSIGGKKKHVRPEHAEEEFLRKPAEASKWHISYAGGALVATNASMELYYEAAESEDEMREVPTSDKQEEWDASGWVIRVPENGATVNRITFPVFTKLITIAMYEKLNLEQRARCYDVDKQLIHYAERTVMHDYNSRGFAHRAEVHGEWSAHRGEW
jgi:hypothetical protein